MTKETEVENTEKTKRQFLKATLVCLFVVAIILGASLGIASYLNQHQAQLIQDNETTPTPTPTINSVPSLTPTEAPNVSVPTPTPTSAPTVTPTSTPTPSATNETAETEEAAVQGVSISVANGITVYAQSTNNVAITINNIIVRNTSSDVVYSNSTINNGTFPVLTADGSLATIKITSTLSGITAGTMYTVTLTSSRGNNFISSSVVAGT